MITFLSILFALLALNGILLVFSVNGAMDGLKKTFKKNRDEKVINLPPSKFPDNDYKNAV